MLQAVGGLDGGGDHAHPRPRRQLGQAVEGLQVRLGEERDHRDAPAVQPPLHLREMREAGDRGRPLPRRRRPARDRRQVAEQHLVHADRKLRRELPAEEVELRRAALDEEHRDGPADGGEPRPGHAEDAQRHVVGGHPEGRRADHRILQKGRAPGRGRARRQRRGHEHPLAPARLHVPAPLEILDRPRHRVRIDAEEPGQLPDAGQGVLPRDAAALDDVLELLRQLPADRDRAVGIHAQADRDSHTVRQQ